MLELFNRKRVQAKFAVIIQLHWDIITYRRFFDMRLGDRQDLLNNGVDQMPKFGKAGYFQRACVHDTSVQRGKAINLAMT